MTLYDPHIRWMRLDDLVPAKRNSRRHDLDGLGDAIKALGFTTQLMLDEETGELVWGHGRLAELRRMRDAGDPLPDYLRADDDGEWKVPVIRGWHSRDPLHADAVREADNRQHERGSYDDATSLDVLGDLAGSGYDLSAIGTSSEELDRLTETADRTDLDALGTVLMPVDGDPFAKTGNGEHRDDEQWTAGDDPDEGSSREEEGPGPLDVEPAWRTIEPLRARYHDGTPDGADAVARWLRSHATDVHVGPDLAITWRGGDGTDYLPPGKWVTRYRGQFDVLTREEKDDEFVPANEPARRADRDAKPVGAPKKGKVPTAATLLRHGRGLVTDAESAVAAVPHTADHD